MEIWIRIVLSLERLAVVLVVIFVYRFVQSTTKVNELSVVTK